MRVGIFDSGIGGLTVLRELIFKYPHNQYFYFGDNTHMPYGSKSKEELKKLSQNNIDFLLSKNVDIIIVACGTVSANLGSYLKRKYQIPIYDVISPTIKFLNNSNFNKIGLLATEMTIKSKVFDKVKKDLFSVACPLLVPLIEANKDTTVELQEYLKKLPKDIDALVLGCTHYPILIDQIKREIPNVNIINMGQILCEDLNIFSGKETKIRLYFGKVDHQLIENINRIITKDYQLEEIYAGVTRSRDS